MATLPAPRNVSPLIRFSRWAALLGGLAYGTMRYNSLVKKEVKIQEVEDKIREKRTIRLAAEKELRDKEEMISLGKEAGVVAK